MSNIVVIIKKEISDAMSNSTFLLSVGVFIACMVLTSVASGNAYFIGASATTGGIFWWKRIVLIFNVIPPIRFLGAIMAIAFSFTSINKERSEGSLKVLLSYPIYRDHIILGKLAAGLMLITIIILVSMSVTVGLYLFITNTFLTLDLMMRFGEVTLLSILLLTGYLGLGMLLSVMFKDPKKTLLVAFFILGLFNSVTFVSFGNIITNAVYGYEKPYFGFDPWMTGDFLNPLARWLQDFITNLNPSAAFSTISLDAGFLTRVVFAADGSWKSYPTDFWSTLLMHLNHIAVLIALPILTYSLSYILFTRSDVS